MNEFLPPPQPIFNLADIPSNYADILSPIAATVCDRLTGWFEQSDFLVQAAIPFGATVESSRWVSNALDLRQRVLDGDYATRLEVRSSAELKGALGAYSATGTTGQPTVYLNGDWLSTATGDRIQAVLLEELGHSFDDQINGGVDSAGDEGAIFAALVQGVSLDANQLDLLQSQDDRNTLTLDGHDLVVEQAINFNPASPLWESLARTGDPDKQNNTDKDGGWTAAASDLVGNNANPYLQIQADGTNIAFKVLAEPQSGVFKALMGIFVDVDGDGSPDFTIQLDVGNVTGGYNVGRYQLIPIFKGTTAEANTRPNNTVIPAENTGTYFNLKEGNLLRPDNVRVFGAAGADVVLTPRPDVDGDNTPENYYVFSFSLAQLDLFRSGINTALYKEIPQWPADQTNIYAAGLTASNSLNAINGDIGGGPYSMGSSWKDIFGFEPPLPPIAANDTATGLEDGGPITGNLLANDTDPNNDPLRVSQFVVGGTTYPLNAGTPSQTVTLAGSGTLAINQNGSYSFTPAPNYTGPVPLVTYTVSDGALSSTATLAISISPVNDGPTGADKTLTINEDTGYAFSVSDFGFADPNDTPANSFQGVVVTTLPAAGTGTLTLNGVAVTAGQEIAVANLANLVYTPGPDQNGNNYASFTFQVRDNGGTANGGVNLSAPSRFTFNVTPVNDAPVANPDTAIARELGFNTNTNSVITAGINPTGNVLTNDTDVDAGDTKTVLNPGTFTGLYGSLTIGANGAYTYTVDNANPTVQALRLQTNTLAETFTYTVADGAGATSSSTLTVTIQGANDAPVAVNDINIAKESITGVTGTNAVGNVLANDTDVDGNGETKIVAGLTASASGVTTGSSTLSSITLSGVTGIVAQSGSYKGDAVFKLNIATGLFEDTGARVDTIAGTTINLKNNGGAVTSITVSSNEELRFYQTTSGTGAVVAPLTSEAIATAVVTPTSSTIVSVSAITDSILVGMTVAGSGIPGGTTVTAINANGTITINNAVLLSSSTSLSFSRAPGTITGTHGTLVLNADGSYTYTPFSNNPNLNQGEVKNDTFTYTMQDAGGLSSKAVLTIQVEGTGTPDPIASPDVAIVNESGGLNNATATVPASPISGNVKTNDTDPQGSTTFTITNVGLAPTALAAVAAGSTSSASPTTVVGNYGTLVMGADGSYTYTLNNNNTAVEALRTSSNTLSDAFYYRVTDSTGNTSTTTLTVTVQGANDNPVAVADTATATEAGGTGNAVPGVNPSGNVLANDTDVDAGDTKLVSAASVGVGSVNTFTGSVTLVGTYGSLVLNADGSYTYTVNNGNAAVNALAEGQIVNDVFTYQVRDTAGGTATSTLTIAVNGANDAPINTVPGAITVAEASATPLTGISVSDPDNAPGQDLTSELATVRLTVNNGSLTIGNLPNGAIISGDSKNLTLSGTQEEINATLVTLSYQGDTYFSGVDTLTVLSTDGLGLTDTSAISITVNPDDRVLSVSSPTVNEASPYAVFTVTGAIGQQVGLSLTGGTATLGSDFSPNLEYWSGSAWVAYTGVPVAIPGTIPGGAASGGQLFVRTAILNDKISEGSETFTLTATNTASTGNTGTGTIFDNGTGTIFNDNGSLEGSLTKDDDRPFTVNSPTVNEASPFIIFEVGGAANQWVKLAINGGSATLGTDFGGTLQYWNGTGWANYTPNSFIQLPGSGPLLVRTSITNDALYEGAENFGLTATNTGGRIVQGIGTIVDDGTGVKFPDANPVNGNPVIDTANLDNDLALAVVATGPVNEASPYAFFTVTGTAGQTLFLTLGNTLDTTDKDATITNFTMEYSIDGGTTWQPYPIVDVNDENAPPSGSSLPVIPGTGIVYVRVNITSEADTDFEGPETFTLKGEIFGGVGATRTATTTIVDDGTGSKYAGTITGGAPTPDPTNLDDDRVLSVNSITVNEASPYAVFTVTGVAGQLVELALTDNTALSPADFETGIEYWDGTVWVAYTADTSVAIPAGGTTLLVRNPIVNDTTYEGSETFTLTATYTSGGTKQATGTGTIVDDGTGVKFPDVDPDINGNPVTEITNLDDDRVLTVTSPTVTEGVNAYAVFAIAGVAGQTLTLETAGSGANPATKETDGTLNNGEDFGNGGLEYSLDGGANWLLYGGGNITLPPGGGLLVRTSITDDGIVETNETFSLTVTYTSGGSKTALGTATIRDNGSPPATDNDTNAVDEDAIAPATGNVLLNDGAGLTLVGLQAGATTTTDPTQPLAGSYGSLTWASDGTYSYSLDNGNPVVQALTVGQTLSEVFTYTVSDGSGGSATATLSITINGLNDAPVIDLDSTQPGTGYVALYNPVAGSVAIAPATLTLLDVDDANLASATITLANRLNGGDERLVVGTLPGGITAEAYDPTTGTLTMKGLASLSAYQDAIAAVAYENIALFPNRQNRTVEVVVSDGKDSSNTAITLLQWMGDGSNGTDGNDIIYGVNPDGSISGLSNPDIFYGYGGDDIITGGSDTDVIFGGSGNDMISGGSGNDSLYGEEGDDIINGGSGNDYLDGGPGNDVLSGGSGSDWLVGGLGDDVLSGGGGNDVLIGGPGNDLLIGGQGKDIFKYQTLAEGFDTIVDFEILHDRIDLSDIGGLTWGNVQLAQSGVDTLFSLSVGGQTYAMATLLNVNANTLSDRHFVLST